MEKRNEIEKYAEEKATTFGELCVQSENVTITSPEVAEEVGKWLAQVKTNAKELDKTKKEDQSIPKEYIKWSNSVFKKPETLLTATEKNLKQAFLDWYLDEEKRVSEAKATEEKKAESRRKRFLTYADKEEGRALEAESEGDVRGAEIYREKAEEYREKAALVEVEVVEDEVRLAEGIYIVRNWSAEVTDKKALFESVIEGDVDMEAFEPNMVYLNGLARRIKKSNIPGLRFKVTPTISMRIKEK